MLCWLTFYAPQLYNYQCTSDCEEKGQYVIHPNEIEKEKRLKTITNTPIHTQFTYKVTLYFTEMNRYFTCSVRLFKDHYLYPKSFPCHRVIWSEIQPHFIVGWNNVLWKYRTGKRYQMWCMVTRVQARANCQEIIAGFQLKWMKYCNYLRLFWSRNQPFHSRMIHVVIWIVGWNNRHRFTSTKRTTSNFKVVFIIWNKTEGLQDLKHNQMQ